MIYLGYITLYLLQTRLETITAQEQMISRRAPTEIIYDDYLPKESLFSREQSLYETTLHPTIQNSARKYFTHLILERENVKRKYGYIPKVTTIRSHLGYIQPQAYKDTYSPAMDAQNKGFLRLDNNRPDLTQILGSVTLEAKIGKPEETVNAFDHDDYDDIDNTERIVPNIGAPTFTVVNPEVYDILYNESRGKNTNAFYGSLSESDLHDARTTEKNMRDFYGSLNETDLHDDTAPTTATTNELTTVGGVHLYALYTNTRIITLNKTRGKIISRMQTRSTYPPESGSPVNLQSIKNYKEALTKIYGGRAATKSTMLGTFETTDSQFDQYLKFGAFDVLHRSIQEINNQGFETYEALYNKNATGNSNHVNGNSKKIMEDTIKRSFVPIINVPSLTRSDKVSDTLGTEIDKYKVPLNKIASGKASFNVDYNYYHSLTTKKVIQATNTAEGNLYNGVYPELTETDNKKVKDSIRNAAFPQNIARQRGSAVEKIDGIGVIKSDWAPTWIKTVTTPNGISYKTSKQVNGVTNAFATAYERFKEPLLKLASMKASFYNGNYHHKKEKELLAINKAKGILNPYSTEKSNVKINNAFAQGSNPAYLRTPMEKLDNIHDTESVPPWITTSTPKRASHVKYLPKLRQMSTTIEPWQLTKVFTVPTTESPQMLSTLTDEDKIEKIKFFRSHPETQRFGEIDAKPEPSHSQIFKRFEPKLDDVASANEENEPFSIFLKKLMKILASKSLQDLRELIKSFNRYVKKLLASGVFMKLGTTTSSYIAKATKMFHTPINQIQRQISIIQISLENRRLMLDDDFNAMLDEVDDVYDVGEEEAMQRVLHETKVYPFGIKTGEQIAQGFIDDVLLHPMKRIAGTTHGNVVFEYIAKVAKKHTLPVEKSVRRSENFDPELITKHNRNFEYISEENEFPNPNYVKKDLSYTKANKNKEIFIRSDIENSKDEDSSKDSKVQIKIQINNIKHSKTDNKRKRRNTGSERIKESRRNARNLNKSRRENFKSDERLNLESYKAKIDDRSNANSKNLNKKGKVKLNFDCHPLPVIVSKDNLSKQNATEVIMYCSNAPNVNTNGK